MKTHTHTLNLSLALSIKAKRQTMKSGQVNWIEMQCECDASRQPARLNTAQYRVGHSYRCRIHIYMVRNPSAVTIYAMLLWFRCVYFLILYSIEAIRVYVRMNSLNIGRGLVSLTLYTYRLPMYLLCVCVYAQRV